MGRKEPGSLISKFALKMLKILLFLDKQFTILLNFDHMFSGFFQNAARTRPCARHSKKSEASPTFPDVLQFGGQPTQPADAAYRAAF